MKGSMFNDDPIVAIDIGTTKICVLVAQQKSPTEIEVIGIGKSPSDGLKKGIVVDINRTIHSIKRAVQEAQLMAGCKIESACVGISGSHINALNSHGIVPIKRKEVTKADVDNVLASARAVALPEGQQILHVLPQFYTIDSQDKVRDPLGMYGVRLEAQVHIITGSISCVQNLIKCCESANVKVTDIVLEQLASALAVLSSDERQLGVGVLDIGGGTSDLAIYHNNSILYTMVLAVAGDHFTNDAALGLRITLQEAERIKQVCGFVSKKHLEQDGIIQVESVQGGLRKNILLSELCSILEPRAYELFSLIDVQLKKHFLKPYMPAGLVLTGGGSLLEGMEKLAAEVFQMPVRIGKPRAEHYLLESLDDPKYATGYGLLLHVIQKRDAVSIARLNGPLVARIAARMKSWVSDLF